MKYQWYDEDYNKLSCTDSECVVTMGEERETYRCVESTALETSAVNFFPTSSSTESTFTILSAHSFPSNRSLREW